MNNESWNSCTIPASPISVPASNTRMQVPRRTRHLIFDRVMEKNIREETNLRVIKTTFLPVKLE